MIRFVDDSNAPDLSGPATRAIVTMVVGDDYWQVWNGACRENWERYAERHGYDVIVLATLLDHSERGRHRSPAWQKLLIFEQAWAQRYERIVWIDADILISHVAPDIIPCVPDATKIGICRAGAQLSPAELHIYLEHLYRCPIAPEIAEGAALLHHRGQYENAGMAPQDNAMLNTGVFVASPLHHQSIMREIYAGEGTSRLYEQPLFSQLLAAHGLIQPFTPRFNWSVHEWMTIHFPQYIGAPDVMAPPQPPEDFERLVRGLQGEMEKAYFLHFSGSMPMLRILADLKRDHGFRFAA